MSRVRNLRFRFGLATILAIAAVPATAQTWGFEDGSLGPWTATGDAFASQPTFGNNVAPRRPGESPGNDGNFWLGTFENHRSAGAPFGDTQGDGPQGTLTSPPFVIEGQSIAFLIGGGRDLDREYVALLVKWEPGMPPPGNPAAVTHLPDGDYLTFQKATGRDDEHMIRTIWVVDRWVGRTARLQVVDRASGPWGHINADSFQFSWVAPLGRAVPVSGLGTAVPVGQGQPATAYPVGGGSIVVSPPAQGQPATAYPVGGGTVTVSPPSSGLGTAVPVGQGQPATAYPVGGGSITVSPPAQGGGSTGRIHEVEEVLPQVQRDPGSAPGPGESGHFQLIAVQFIANHQTRDDALEMDGPGDEIQVRSDALTFAPDGRFVRNDTKTSGIFGAPDRWDFVAGTAIPGFSPRADAGGFKSGDIYPNAIRPVRSNGDLPMVLWDGVLARGGGGVVIIPSLWEIEDRGVSRAQSAWDAGLARDRSLGASVVLAFGNTVEDWDGPVHPNLVGSTGVFDDGNRPIGAATHRAHFPFGALPHDRGMTPQSIPLTYDKAMIFASARATALSLQTEPGLSVADNVPVPPGGIVMHFVDPPGNDGDYYLIMQLVRVD